jgi:hypothetical protein
MGENRQLTRFCMRLISVVGLMFVGMAKGGVLDKMGHMTTNSNAHGSPRMSL